MAKKKKKKVFVALLNMGTVSAGLETAIYKWMQQLADVYQFYFCLRTARPISSNRNGIAKEFLETDYDVLCMIDDDNPPSPERNPFELVRYNKDVIGIPYPGRDWKGVYWHIYDFKVEDEKGMIYKPIPVEKRKGLQRVGAVATGFIFIKRKVLEKIKRPFEDSFDEYGILVNNDDLNFAFKCKKAGFEQWAHWDYYCSHYKKVDLLQMLRLIQMAKREGRGETKFVTTEEVKRKKPVNKRMVK